jgi:hypothetical protein
MVKIRASPEIGRARVVKGLDGARIKSRSVWGALGAAKQSSLSHLSCGQLIDQRVSAGVRIQALRTLESIDPWSIARVAGGRKFSAKFKPPAGGLTQTAELCGKKHSAILTPL